jgi:hypothetical protein
LGAHPRRPRAAHRLTLRRRRAPSPGHAATMNGASEGLLRGHRGFSCQSLLQQLRGASSSLELVAAIRHHRGRRRRLTVNQAHPAAQLCLERDPERRGITKKEDRILRGHAHQGFEVAGELARVQVLPDVEAAQGVETLTSSEELFAAFADVVRARARRWFARWRPTAQTPPGRFLGPKVNATRVSIDPTCWFVASYEDRRVCLWRSEVRGQPRADPCHVLPLFEVPSLAWPTLGRTRPSTAPGFNSSSSAGSGGTWHLPRCERASAASAGRVCFGTKRACRRCRSARAPSMPRLDSGRRRTSTWGARATITTCPMTASCGGKNSPAEA